MATAPLRYALIGTGQMGHGHIGALAHVEGGERAAAERRVVDIAEFGAAPEPPSRSRQ